MALSTVKKTCCCRGVNPVFFSNQPIFCFGLLPVGLEAAGLVVFFCGADCPARRRYFLVAQSDHLVGIGRHRLPFRRAVAPDRRRRDGKARAL